MSILWLLPGAVLGYLACYLDAPAWLLACWARILGAQWYAPRQHCPPCGRQVHLLRYHPEREGTFGPGDDGKRCTGCSHRTPRIAPGPAQEGTGMPRSIDGWLQAPAPARARSEASNEERTDR